MSENRFSFGRKLGEKEGKSHFYLRDCSSPRAIRLCCNPETQSHKADEKVQTSNVWTLSSSLCDFIIFRCNSSIENQWSCMHFNDVISCKSLSFLVSERQFSSVIKANLFNFDWRKLKFILSAEK